MRRAATASGYTILEVMIFLVVSSALLVTAMILIAGRQDKAQFAQGVRDFDSKLQDIINDVATGNYSNNTNVGCVAGSGAPPTLSSAPSTLGTNEQCIYVGLAIQFAPSSGQDRMVIYSLAGNRQTSGANPREVTNLAEAKPIAVARGTIYNSGGPDTSEVFRLSGGLKIKQVSYNAAGFWANNMGALGVLTTFGSYGSNGLLQTGTVRTNMVAFMGGTPGLGDTTTKAVDFIDTALLSPGGPTLNPAGGFAICLDGGSQWAIVTIAGGGATTTSVTTYNNQAAANAAFGGANLCA